MTYELILGNCNTSSWSLRPWLAMTMAELEFTETFVRLTLPDGTYDPRMKENILAHVPSGFVPALRVDEHLVWDTMAIAETLAERHHDAHLWPDDPATRAHARAVSAEMHAGFSALRGACPMDFVHTRAMRSLAPEVSGDVRRIVEVWSGCRKAHSGNGPFLYGRFSIADAMYAPVVSRFKTYEIDLAAHGDDGSAAAYAATIRELPAMQLWAEKSRAELGAELGGVD